MKRFGRLLALLALLSFCPGVAHSQGQAGSAAPLPDRGTATGAGLSLLFVSHDAAGLPNPATATTVQLVTFTAARREGEKPKQRSSEQHTSGRDGVLKLPPSDARTLRSLRFSEAGATTEVRLPGSGVHKIGIYQRQLTDDDVEMDVRANLSVRDGGTSTWLEITITTGTPGVRTWTQRKPLILPLLAPAVRGAVLDRGAITKATKNIEVQTRDAVKVVREGGGLALVGSVAPGRPISLRIRYGMAIEEPMIDLGLRGAVGKTTMSVATIATPPVLLSMSVDRPARVAEHREGRERYTGASIIHPLKRGEVVRVRLIGFPARAAWPGRMLGGLTVAMVLLFGALALRRVREPS